MLTRTQAFRAGRNLILLEKTASIINQCARRGLRPIPVKGISLLLTLYSGDESSRNLADVDFFVQPRELKGVLDVLTGAGCRCERSGEYHYILPDPKGGHAVIFDVHTDVPYLTPHAYRRLWGRTRSTYIKDVTVYLLDERDEIIYLVYHAAVQHGSLDGEWALDLDALIRRYVSRGGFDWTGVAGELRRRRLGLPAAMLFERLVRKLGTPLPKELAHVFNPCRFGVEARAYRFLTRRSNVWTLGHVLRLFIMNNSERFFYLFRFVFPSVEFMERRYGCEGVTSLALAYIYRPFATIGKVFSLLSRVLKKA